MRQMWVCDFCSEKNKDPSVIEEHQRNCSFNPATKRCMTCLHSSWEGMPMSGFWTVCKAGMSRDHIEEVEDREIACDSWEPEKD